MICFQYRKEKGCIKMSAFDKIFGYSAIKEELRQISDILRCSAPYDKLGVTAPRGLLLYGEPGVGKSMMASAVIEESGRKAFTCRKDSPNGDFVKKIKSIFERAAENAPAIVYLDDMDKFANEDAYHPDAEEYVTVQSCIDEVKDQQVFVLATANDIDCLPESLRRAGRFDRKIKVNVPCGQDAERIIDHFLRSKHFASEIDTGTIARMLDGHSCAELESIINVAGFYAGYERADHITMQHFKRAYARAMFDAPFEDDVQENIASDQLHLYAAYHEAGHTVISEVLRPGSVSFVSAYSQKNECEGFTHFYDDHSRIPLYWRISSIIVALGGMAAVEQKFGVRDIGAKRDLEMAFDEVRALVTETCICGFHLYSPEWNASDFLMHEQEQVVASEIERYYQKAKEILALNREFFEKLASAIAEKKLLTAADVQAIKLSCKIVPLSI